VAHEEQKVFKNQHPKGPGPSVQAGGQNISGCPFFNKEITDPQGKNLTRGFPLKYISKFDFLFKQSKTDLRGKLNPKKNPKQTEFLDSLPFLVKHSLLLEQETMVKLRKLNDSAQLLFIADDTKLKGNKQYDLGNYYQALQVYEWVLGCYVWLEFQDEEL